MGKEGIPRRGCEPTCFKGFDMAVASLLTRDAVCKWDRLIAGEGCLTFYLCSEMLPFRNRSTPQPFLMQP